jgi:hypothetical protein
MSLYEAAWRFTEPLVSGVSAVVFGPSPVSVRWDLIVFSEMPSRCEIADVGSPLATSAKTSCSRRVNGSPLWVLRGLCLPVRAAHLEAARTTPS